MQAATECTTDDAAGSVPAVSLSYCIRAAAAAFALSSVVVLLGVQFGVQFVAVRNHQTALDGMLSWDGQHYRTIAENGYDFRPDAPSNVAFFPAFPLAAGGLAWATRMSAPSALVVVSNACLAGCFALLALYVRDRYARAGPGLVWSVLAALALVPLTFFFHMAYSESMFVLVSLVALYAMRRRWPLVVIALVVGLATAVRPVGVALVPVLLLYLWRVEPHAERHLGQRLLQIAWVVPLSVWGLIGYMTYLGLKFDAPLAFATTQSYWRMRPEVDLGSRAMALLTLEPIWSVYVPNAANFWRVHEIGEQPYFSLLFANPIYFVATAALVLVGARKRWLDGRETLLSAGLLLIPYVTRSFEMCMASQARFAAAVFPIYLVLGRALNAAPPMAAGSVAAIGGLLLGAYAALFAAGFYLFF